MRSRFRSPGRGHWRLPFVFLLVACAADLAWSQTIRPVRSEYRLRANGNFQLVNEGFTPLNVVLETHSFTVSETGEISYWPLDPGIEVRLSENSFRIPPKQTYLVAYSAKATVLPAYFVIYAGMTIAAPVKSVSGMNLTIKLPHTVYILPRRDATKAEIRVKLAKYEASAGKVRIEVFSESSSFARVLATEVLGKSNKAEGEGFPLFPKSERKLEIDWPASAPPQKVILRFEKFRIEEPISVE